MQEIYYKYKNFAYNLGNCWVFMNRLLIVTLLLGLIACSDNSELGDVVELRDEDFAEAEVVNGDSHLHSENNINFEEYKEFPNYNLEDMGEFLHKKLLVSLMNKDYSELSETDKYNIGYIGLNYRGLRKEGYDEGEEEYENRFEGAGNNPFKIERINREIYDELKNYTKSVDSNKKYVFDIYTGDYSSEYSTINRPKDLPPVVATLYDYNSYEPPLDSYNINDGSFDLFSVNSVSAVLESLPEIRQLGNYSSINTDHTNLRELYVDDRAKAEYIQDLIDKNELGMVGKVYVSFIDSNNTSNVLLNYDVDGLVLNFYDKKTNEIVATAQDFKKQNSI